MQIRLKCLSIDTLIELIFFRVYYTWQPIEIVKKYMHDYLAGFDCKVRFTSFELN